jgi:hypothetical protein
MSDFVNTIDLLGDKAVTKAIVERTIAEFNDNVITEVGQSAFYACIALTSVDFPNAIRVNKSAFYNCTSLASVNLPNLYSGASGDSGVFQSCKALKNVNIPLAPAIYGSYFYGCSSLEFLDLPSVKQFAGSSALYNCTALKTIALRYESVVALNYGTGVFSGTPFASGKAGGTLLVPRSITASYPTATNWSSLFESNANNRVLALEDYTVDGTITGEIDWDKLNGGN